MGWARTLLLGDVGNRLDIADAERGIEDVKGAVRASRQIDQSQDDAIAQLKRENEELELCVAVLIKMLERKGVLSADEVQRLVQQIEY